MNKILVSRFVKNAKNIEKIKECCPNIIYKTCDLYSSMEYPNTIKENRQYPQYGLFMDYLIRKIIASKRNMNIYDSRAEDVLFSSFLPDFYEFITDKCSRCDTFKEENNMNYYFMENCKIDVCDNFENIVKQLNENIYDKALSIYKQTYEIINKKIKKCDSKYVNIIALYFITDKFDYIENRHIYPEYYKYIDKIRKGKKYNKEVYDSIKKLKKNILLQYYSMKYKKTKCGLALGYNQYVEIDKYYKIVRSYLNNYKKPNKLNIKKTYYTSLCHAIMFRFRDIDDAFNICFDNLISDNNLDLIKEYIHSLIKNKIDIRLNPNLSCKGIIGEADIILDDILVEIKTSKNKRKDEILKAFYQAIIYASLEYYNNDNKINTLIILNPLLGIKYTLNISKWNCELDIIKCIQKIRAKKK